MVLVLRSSIPQGVSQAPGNQSLLRLFRRSDRALRQLRSGLGTREKVQKYHCGRAHSPGRITIEEAHKIVSGKESQT
jgi:hypothetical protein